jgi:hypothetical protein
LNNISARPNISNNVSKMNLVVRRPRDEVGRDILVLQNVLDRL